MDHRKVSSKRTPIYRDSSFRFEGIAQAEKAFKDETGTWLFFSELYGGTHAYMDTILIQSRGIQVERFTLEEKEEQFNRASLAEIFDRVKPQLIFFESISNPLLIVADKNV